MSGETVELKPCPFCGGTQISIYPDEVGSGGQHVSPYHAACDRWKGGCGVSVVGDTEEQASAVWNRRTYAEALSALPAAPEAANTDEQWLKEAARLIDEHGLNCAAMKGNEESEAAQRSRAAVLAHLRQRPQQPRAGEGATGGAR